jgi:hypothetical protein
MSQEQRHLNSDPEQASEIKEQPDGNFLIDGKPVSREEVAHYDDCRRGVILTLELPIPELPPPPAVPPPKLPQEGDSQNFPGFPIGQVWYEEPPRAEA